MSASLCCLLFVGIFVFVSAEQKNITAESGQNVTLTGRGPSNKNIRVVEWSRTDLGDKFVLLYRDGRFIPNEQHPSFKNRVELQDRQMKDGDVSLIMKNVTVNDTGTYECRVFTEETRSLQLITIIYLVVAPPGQPGGDTEDGGKEDESVGLIVGLSVSAVLLLAAAAVVGFFIYRKHKQPILDSSQPSAEL